MQTAKKKENPYFLHAEAAIKSIAHILIALKENGQLTPEMKDAMRQHAEGLQSTLPAMINCLASSIASANAFGGSLDSDTNAHANWGIAFMADALDGMSQIVESYGPNE
jgi:hypothetical protein